MSLAGESLNAWPARRSSTPKKKEPGFDGAHNRSHLESDTLRPVRNMGLGQKRAGVDVALGLLVGHEMVVQGLDGSPVCRRLKGIDEEVLRTFFLDVRKARDVFDMMANTP